MRAASRLAISAVVIVALGSAGPAAAEPAGPAPGVPGGPPPAWVDSPLGAWWLEPGGGCWGTAGKPAMCATVPAFSDRPLIRVRVGERVTLHLGRDPEALAITNGVRRVHCARGLEPNPTTTGRQVPVRRPSGVVSWTARPSDHGYLTVSVRYPQGDPRYRGRIAIVTSAAGRAPSACRPDRTPPRLVGVQVERTRAGVRTVIAMTERASAEGTLQRLAGGRALLVRRFVASRGPVSSQQVLRFGALAAGVYRLRLTLRDRAAYVTVASRRIVVPAAG
ncbi:MAG: hypothetical protein QOF76_1046 [Solirubrobacteraceae bacterium]|jgi:hypothetical protein|nr:hypothetical protein [Solirubrobacteraceae bacterium]